MIPEPLDAVCSSQEMRWWSGPGCPTLNEYAEGLSADQQWSCDGEWVEATPDSFVVHACAAVADGSTTYEVFFESCGVDTCYGSSALFDSSGEFRFYRSWMSGRLPHVCCDEIETMAGRSWGEFVAVDCSSELVYAPKDLVSCGGEGFPTD